MTKQPDPVVNDAADLHRLPPDQLGVGKRANAMTLQEISNAITNSIDPPFRNSFIPSRYPCTYACDFVRGHHQIVPIAVFRLAWPTTWETYSPDDGIPLSLELQRMLQHDAADTVLERDFNVLANTCWDFAREHKLSVDAVLNALTLRRTSIRASWAALKAGM